MQFGCIADDFTGGSDIASFFAKGGLKTVLFNDIPDGEIDKEVEACVIALKTRTKKTEKAVEESIQSIRWLQAQGAKQFYVKYCSTFDSTPNGNIGPICDAIMEELKVSYTILNPALPVNGRVVKNGCLYVHGVPLHESSMKDHPLTPMWDCDLVKLMKPQSKYPSFKFSSDLNISKKQMKNFLEKKISELKTNHFYIIPDFQTQEDAFLLVKLFGDLKLLTGGSGIAKSLAEMHSKKSELDEFGKINSPAIILSGSCSEATRNQIEEYKKSGGITYFMDPEKILSGEESSETIWKFAEENRKKSVLIYSSDTPENVTKIQSKGEYKIAELLEKTTSDIARKAYDAGYYRIIVAGGETSGAVTKELDFNSYQIGKSVAPGVPIMIPLKNSKVRLVLKSGNFGQSDFFLQALSLT